ncbi:hypothetical protein ASPBRDRAFT_28705 [Aspergillus brasiliensis CBS 101740]|uniref:Uncharacterized protein n=1 Tax=Aspergillus brasiliensis (strain CBS 101740 / IMI 381727 / IBT 21946) TaxID=767769 RepID=A0A1L9UPN8_ASPBC|nr:hypothetical protein ASPBRDRAFT_28705 [Aspergillus brasiliensis CBS 101740]
MSHDLKTWNYTSSLTPNTGVNLDPLECPDLYQIDLDGDFKGHTWILAAGAKGSTVYWFGKWDGKGFTATDAEPQLMDNGPDFYATVSWTNPKDDGIYGSRYAIAWMNNWDMVREVKLQTVKNTPTLVSKPIVGHEGIYDSAKSSQAILVRDSDGSATESMPSDPKKAYGAVATAPNPSGSNTVNLEIYVYSNSVEVFVDDGVAVLSPNKAAKGVQDVSDAGSVTLVSFSYLGMRCNSKLCVNCLLIQCWGMVRSTVSVPDINIGQVLLS